MCERYIVSCAGIGITRYEIEQGNVLVITASDKSNNWVRFTKEDALEVSEYTGWNITKDE